MKKILLGLMVASLLTTTGCDSSKTVIGILQTADHSALDLAREGFISVLENSKYKDEIKFEYHNALGNPSDMQTMSDSLLRKSDLLLGIGTTAAESLKASALSKSKTTPILFTAVTDPVEAHLVESNELPNTHISGTTDMNPVEDQINLIKKILPDATKMGIIYTSNEINSEVQANIAKQQAIKEGLEVIVATIDTAADISSVCRSNFSDVDAVYVPTDNRLASNMPLLAQSVDVPLICGEASMVEAGGHLSLSIDYLKLGELTGQMAIEILDGADISQMAVRSLSSESYELVINEEALNDLGISVPEDLL